MEKLGKYLDKNLYISKIKTLDDLQIKDFSSSVILLCFGKSKISHNKLMQFYNIIIKKIPLALHFAGNNANNYFSLFLKNKFSDESDQHIMTYITKEKKISEWILEFFYSSWPSEERFDDWKDYKIIVINDNSLYIKLSKNIRNFIK